MGESFIPLARSFFVHHFWQEERVYSRAEAWLDLVRLAAWRDHKKVTIGKVIEVPRGGIVASVRFLSDRWKWSNTKVCQFLEVLRADGMITTEKRQGVTLVLLSNYERFNCVVVGENPDENDGETTRRRQRNDEREQGKKDNTAPQRVREEADSEIPDRNTAVAQAFPAGVPGDFAGMVYDDWSTRQGKDAGGTIVPYLPYVKKRWGREAQEWQATTHRSHPNRNKVNGHNSKSSAGGDRNAGTLNEGRAAQYGGNVIRSNRS